MKLVIFRNNYVLSILLIVCSLLLSGNTTMSASVYYLSNNGNDNNDGLTEQTAFQTLEKVNSLLLFPGDKILLKRGDKWTGTLIPQISGTENGKITYSSYGEGDKPQINGIKEITGWEHYQGNIYKASVDEDIDQLFINGERMDVARIPKKGFYYIDEVESDTEFISDELSSSMDYSGSIWVGRTQAWSLFTQKVISCNETKIELDGKPSYNLGVKEGFILLNKFDFITQEGEWAYDSQTKTVYLWNLDSSDPSNDDISGSAINNCINLNSLSYIKIEDIEFCGAKEDCFYARNCTNIEVSNCDFRDGAMCGIYTDKVDSVLIHNCKIDYCSYYGIKNYNSPNPVIKDNFISNIGRFVNIGVSGTMGHSTGKAIVCTGNNTVIEYNTIRNIAYSGIGFRGTNSKIQYNFLQNICLDIDDGAGIYTFNPGSYESDGSSGSVISYNIIENVTGNPEGYTLGFSLGNGIYMDERTRAVLIEHNTISAIKNVGIPMNGAGDIEIHENILYDCGTSTASKDVGFPDKTNITHNTFCNIKSTVNRDGSTARLAKTTTDNNAVTYNYNLYVDHWRTTNTSWGAPFLIPGEYPYGFSFDDWKSLTGHDENSEFQGGALASGEEERLFYNREKDTKTISLGDTIFRDLYGNEYRDSFELESFHSKILIKTNDTSTGLNELKGRRDNDLNLIVFPNPSRGSINIIANSLEPNNYEISIYRLTGECVYKKLFTQNFTSQTRQKIDHNLSAGTYILKLDCDESCCQQKCIIL